MVFYSSDPSVDLYGELAKQRVPGVFVSARQDLDDALKGLADTVIGKAVDLNHMRGIAMAEVAEMDMLMEEVLAQVFSSVDEKLRNKASETLTKLLDDFRKELEKLQELVGEGQILDVVTNARLFSSMHKYKAINRVTKGLVKKPTAAIEILKTYEADILRNRNTLAHAKEETDVNGTVTLRAIKRGQPALTIDEEWMVSFRSKLHNHRAALETVCEALRGHVEALAVREPSKD